MAPAPRARLAIRRGSMILGTLSVCSMAVLWHPCSSLARPHVDTVFPPRKTGAGKERSPLEIFRPCRSVRPPAGDTKQHSRRCRVPPSMTLTLSRRGKHDSLLCATISKSMQIWKD